MQRGKNGLLQKVLGQRADRHELAGVWPLESSSKNRG